MDLSGGTKLLYEWFAGFHWLGWCLFSLVGNFAVFGVSVGLCAWTGRRWGNRPLFAEHQPLTRGDVVLAIVAVLLNSGVGVAGWILWKAGWIYLSDAGWGRTLIDTILFLALMDFGMYWLHRLAHHRWFYRWLHATHHTHESVNPISLFVLSPFEVIGFGVLMVAVMMVVPFSGAAVLIYLTLNVVFGTLGHAGVEPFPEVWNRLPLLRDIGSSSFHAHHHRTPGSNFGFYTTVWDRIFGTINAS